MDDNIFNLLIITSMRLNYTIHGKIRSNLPYIFFLNGLNSNDSEVDQYITNSILEKSNCIIFNFSYECISQYESISDISKDIYITFKDTVDKNKVIIIGKSLGGLICIDIALQYSHFINYLILVDSMTPNSANIINGFLKHETNENVQNIYKMIIKSLSEYNNITLKANITVYSYVNLPIKKYYKQSKKRQNNNCLEQITNTLMFYERLSDNPNSDVIVSCCDNHSLDNKKDSIINKLLLI